MFANKSLAKKFIRQSYGVNPLEGYNFYNASGRLDKIKRYHLLQEQGDCSVDETTWNDLEMDNVFLRINHTNSFIGEQILYHRLHDLNSDEEVKMEKLVDYFDGNPMEREKIEERLFRIGKHDEDYYLNEFLVNTNLWKVGNVGLYHILQVVLIVFSLLSIFMKTPIAYIGLAMIVIINFMIYWRTKVSYNIYFSSLVTFKSIYNTALYLVNNVPDKYINDDKLNHSLKRLRQLSRIIISLDNRRESALAGDVSGLLIEYIYGILLIDVTAFSYIMKAIENKVEDVETLMKFVGEIDAGIAVSSYRASVAHWCSPLLEEQGIEVEDIIHPLLENPVPNNWKLTNKAMITGANASGKSTFMKSIAINCILAQTIYTCTASKMLLKPVKIMTCMALRDNIITGESYYMQEIKCLKEIVNQAGREDVLVVLDEMLKGTNTAERIAASKAILDYLGDSNMMIIVATHDDALTENAKYEQFHFKGLVENDRLLFDYRIYEGKNKNRNAIELLAILGYPSVIVEKARAKYYANR